MSSNDLSQLSPEEQEAVLDGPALRPPPGIESNFDNPPNRNIIPESVIPICLTLVTMAIILRGYARVFIVKKLHVDDVISLLGFGTYIAYVYCVYYSVDAIGFFVHQWNITVRDMMDVQHVLQIGATCYTITLLLIKAAILLQWIRMFAPIGTRGAFFWTCQVILWINVLFYLSVTIAGNLICVPFQRIWDKTVPGSCYNGRPLNFTIGVFNFASDILILLLPQRIIWRLNMSLKRKLGIALMFAVGLIACAAAAFRMGVTINYMTDPDWMYRVGGLSIGCIAEMTCIQLVYCMPSIPMTFKESTILSRYFNSFRTSLRSVTRLGSASTSAGSGTDPRTSSHPEKIDKMGAGDIPLDEFHRPRFQPSESTEQLQVSRRNVLYTGNSLDGIGRTTRFIATEQ